MDKHATFRALAGDPGNYYCQASESERQTFRDWMITLLREQEVVVDFVKADGDFRSMKCTLNEGLGAKYSGNESKKRPNPEVCVVWDINQSAWRSFRWDRMKRVQFAIG